MSLIEAVTNLVVGYALAIATQLFVFRYSVWTRIEENLMIGGIFTVVSLARSYAVRRLFDRWVYA
jgi:hypothetical protein